MAKFELPKNEPSQNKTIRFPPEVIQGVEAAIAGTNCTFSAFVVASVRMALKDLEEQQRHGDT